MSDNGKDPVVGDEISMSIQNRQHQQQRQQQQQQIQPSHQPGEALPEKQQQAMRYPERVPPSQYGNDQ